MPQKVHLIAPDRPQAPTGEPTAEQGQGNVPPQAAHHLLRGTEPLKFCLTQFLRTKLLFYFFLMNLFTQVG